MRRLFGLGLGAACLFLCGRADAGYVNVFTNHNTNTVASNFQASPGGSVTVDVYLEQTGSDTGITDFGLAGAGVRLSVVNPQPTHPAGYLSNADLQANAIDYDVTQENLDNSPTSGFITDFAFNNPNPTGVLLSDGNIGQLIGSFTLHVPGNAPIGEVTIIQAGPVANNSQDDILGDLNATDVTPSNPTSATITVPGGVPAVPEPPSVILAGISALCGAVGYTWRRTIRLARVRAG